MLPRRMVFLVGAVLLIIGASYVVNRGATGVPAAPVAPVALDGEDASGGVGMKTTDELIAFWDARVARDPRDFISMTFLAGSFMHKARETGDIAQYQRAETTIHQALAIDPDYEGAQAYLAAVRYTQHDFTGALTLATQVYAAHPNIVSALATMGDAQLELGNYKEAEAAYQRLNQRNPGPAVESRLSRLAWLQGHPDQAIALMQQATAEAQDLALTGESAAWYQFQLGELYFQTGNPDRAAGYYSQALDLFPNYYLALAGLGKARAAQERYPEAIGYYQQAVAIIPQPDFLAALGDLYTLTGEPAKAQQQYDTVEFIGKLAAINKVIYNRQLALFYANHDRKLDEALALTTQELAARKDIYGYDAQAWALYKRGQYQEAQAAMQQAMKLGTQDALLDYHAGMIAKSLGDTAQARLLLSRALARNPHFDLLQARVARAALP
ncbi:MAG TPA: tetratricopeptide repeat protein [Chloroflexia bacterium]|nr:tetratricopeptide repeat protein [Chloroflexia bacterium]